MMKHRMLNLSATIVLLAAAYGCDSGPPSTRLTEPTQDVANQARGEKVNERVATVRVIPDSKSIVLRSTHILLIRILKLNPEAWRQDGSRTLQLTANLDALLKGTVRERVNESFAASVSQKQKRTPFILPPTDCWSDQPLAVGSRVIVFSRSKDSSAAEMLPDPKCQKVVAADDFLNDVRLAVSAETERWNLLTLLDHARPVAPQLNYIFPEYLEARFPELHLEEPQNLEGTLRFLESPELSYRCRVMLLEEVTTYITMSNSASDADLDRLAITMFRLLSLPQAAELHDTLVETDLPNLLGLVGGGKKRSASQVFARHPSDRETAERAVNAYHGSAPKQPLLGWFKGVQHSGVTPR